VQQGLGDREAVDIAVRSLTAIADDAPRHDESGGVDDADADADPVTLGRTSSVRVERMPSD
jgi:hypothetical protein